MAVEMKTQVPDDAVRAIVMAEVVKALGSPEEMVAGFIRRLMTEKENNYSNSPTKIEKMVSELLYAQAREIVKEVLAERTPELRAAMEKEFETRRFKRSLADALLGSLNQGAYKINVSLTLGQGRDY